MMMTRKQVERITADAATDATLASLDRELRAKLKAVITPEDHVQMAQAYEAYSEASFYLAMKDRGVVLERTPGTGEHKAKRPDFRYSGTVGHLYFEVKALEIAEEQHLAQQAIQTKKAGVFFRIENRPRRDTPVVTGQSRQMAATFPVFSPIACA